VKIVVTADPERAAAAAAEWMARRMRTAVLRRGVCRIAVSGGSTPAKMFDGLAALALPWEAIHVFQVDERVAPDGDPDRNAGQLTAHLTDRVPIRRANVHLMPVTQTALGRAAAKYATQLGDAPLDIVHLGIGDDGHTASWPPGDPVIDETDPVAVTNPFNGRVRMTLTPGIVNSARLRMVLVVGSAKASPLAGWLLHDAVLPIARVKRANTTVIADAGAAADLPDVEPERAS
jgi:6-phosphogluconolactonase